jgi:hypothetical protein
MPASHHLLARAAIAACLACTAVGCARLALGPALTAATLPGQAAVPWASATDLPRRAEVQTGQLVIHADFPLAEQHRIVRDLENLRADVSQSLDMPISD